MGETTPTRTMSRTVRNDSFKSGEVPFHNGLETYRDRPTRLAVGLGLESAPTDATLLVAANLRPAHAPP